MIIFKQKETYTCKTEAMALLGQDIRRALQALTEDRGASATMVGARAGFSSSHAMKSLNLLHAIGAVAEEKEGNTFLFRKLPKPQTVSVKDVVARIPKPMRMIYQEVATAASAGSFLSEKGLQGKFSKRSKAAVSRDLHTLENLLLLCQKEGAWCPSSVTHEAQSHNPAVVYFSGVHLGRPISGSAEVGDSGKYEIGNNWPSDPEACVSECLRRIKEADLVFAWFDDPKANWAFFEIGHAIGIGKPVFIGMDMSLRKLLSTERKTGDMSPDERAFIELIMAVTASGRSAAWCGNIDAGLECALGFFHKGRQP